MQRVFSGIQPSGIPTLGNYLGAIRNWVTLQDDHDCIWCVVDLHAITVWQDPTATAPADAGDDGGAAGLRHRSATKHILFLQSAVRAHAQLAWIFNCVARLGWLNRMTQFKDKAGKDRENASAGLYVYPNLMAADILAYHATARAGRRRPAPASGTGERHRAEVQPRLRRRFLPAISSR